MKPTYIIYIICFFFSLSACKKFLDINPPVTKLVTETVFNNDSTAVGAIKGLYNNLSSSTFANGSSTSSITFYSALSSDELTSYSTSLNNLELYKNSILPTNAALAPLWEQPYKTIFISNSIIEGLSKSVNVSQTIKTQLIGEALFIRAFCHFYLINLFGDAPLVITTDYRINTQIPKTSKELVYAQIIRDLNEAKNMLPENFTVYGNERTRVSRSAATALLARVYLYNRSWSLAGDEATEIINNKTLFDTVALNNVFLKNSKESIWQIRPLANALDGTNFILTTAPSSAAGSSSTVSDYLLDAFEQGDSRKSEMDWDIYI